MLQEFDIKIKDKMGCENLVATHLYRLVNENVTLKKSEIRKEFLDEALMLVKERPWFADTTNFKTVGIILEGLN